MRPLHVTRLLSMGTGDKETPVSFSHMSIPREGRKETAPYECKFRDSTNDFCHIVLAKAFMEPKGSHKKGKALPMKTERHKELGAFFRPAQTFLFTLSR